MRTAMRMGMEMGLGMEMGHLSFRRVIDTDGCLQCQELSSKQANSMAEWNQQFD